MFFRTEQTVINQILIFILSENTFSSIRIYFVEYISFSNWVVYSLPEGLWVFSTTLISSSFIIKYKKVKIKAFYIPISFVVLWELFQLYGITNGYFDINDILISFIAWIFALSIQWNNLINIKINYLDEYRIHWIFFSYAIVYLSHVIH